MYKWHHAFRLLLNIISYALEDGFRYLDWEGSVFMTFLWIILTFTLVNIQIYFHFRCCAIYQLKFYYNRWCIFIVWNLIGDRFFLWLKTTEFCFMSPDSYSGSGYETSIHQYAYNVLGLEIFSTQVLSYLLI